MDVVDIAIKKGYHINNIPELSNISWDEFEDHEFLRDKYKRVRVVKGGRKNLLNKNDIYEELVQKHLGNNEEKWNAFTGSSLPVGKKVAVYGAGAYGCEVYKRLIRNHNEVLAWYDKNYAGIESRMGIHISDPDELVQEEEKYDYVVVGVHIPEKLESVVEYLVENGINSNKIIIADKYDLSKLPIQFKQTYYDTDYIPYNDLHRMDLSVKYDNPYATTSMICNQEFMDMPFTYYWSKKFKYDVPFYHRKLWEDVYIVHALYERGMLDTGKKGIGFGVGKEFLPDLFASYGCEILATDLNVEDAIEHGWVDTNQHASGRLDNLRDKHFCDDSTFYKMVNYRDVDMNNIPNDIQGYDFCWSACSLEHLGGIRQGADFIKNSMRTLNKGGIAIHTTEFNLFSNEDTIESQDLSLFRKKDMEMIQKELELEGYVVEPFDWFLGTTIYDSFIDLPPHNLKNIHLRLLIDDFPCTSIGIIIHKP